jgi:hypothetical protein
MQMMKKVQIQTWMRSIPSPTNLLAPRDQSPTLAATLQAFCNPSANALHDSFTHVSPTLNPHNQQQVVLLIRGCSYLPPGPILLALGHPHPHPHRTATSRHKQQAAGNYKRRLILKTIWEKPLSPGGIVTFVCVRFCVCVCVSVCVLPCYLLLLASCR